MHTYIHTCYKQYYNMIDYTIICLMTYYTIVMAGCAGVGQRPSVSRCNKL